MSDLHEQLKQLRDDPKFWTFHQTPKLRRLWQLANDMVWVSAEWDRASVATWKPADWVIQLRLRSGVKQFEKDVARFRQEGMMEPDVIRFKFCQRRQLADTLPAAMPSVETRMSAPRPRYPSDEKRKVQSNGHSVEHSADTPQTLHNDSAGAPQSTPQPSRACDTGTGIPVPVLDLYKTPESGTGTGTGIVDRGRSGLTAADTPPILRTQVEPPPITTIERLVELGMTRPKAEARLAEFGEARCRDALDSLPYWANTRKDPVATVVDFLVHQRPLPAALVKAREAAQQQRMPMLSAVDGGATSHQETAPTRPGPAAMQPIAETIKSLHASQLRPPPGTDPPKDVLAAARDAVRRSG